MRFVIVVTESAYGMQQASSAFQSAQALIAEGHKLSSVFFYRERIYSVNQLTSSTSDEFDLVCSQQRLNIQHDVALNICVTAALRRGVIDEMETGRLGLVSSSLQTGFTLNGLGTPARASLTCDRVVQF